MTEQAINTISITELSLPKGGGALKGLDAELNTAGVSGMVALTVPLPISSGRGYAPSLSLQYSSGQGNSEFGAGWQLQLLKISRRTQKGVPNYGSGIDKTGKIDQFVGPNGELLISMEEKVKKNTVNSEDISASYNITRYCSRSESNFIRFEHHQLDDKDAGHWLIYSPDGQIHCLGKTEQGRIFDPENKNKVAVWLLEESLSSTGEHIGYHYLAEDGKGLPEPLPEWELERERNAQRYLSKVTYGNSEQHETLYLESQPVLPQDGWLFTLVLDYGERGNNLDEAPPFDTPENGQWLVRPDIFSRYEYGFELRTYRLCRQVLMYHHFPDQLGDENVLVNRLLLKYEDSPILSTLRSVTMMGYGELPPQSLPPIEFSYTPFSPDNNTGWQSFDLPDTDFDGVYRGQKFQLVDLYKDGVAGILRFDAGEWKYRSPIRDVATDHPDAVTYADWETLPLIPGLRPENAYLADINNDFELDWIVTSPGLSGFFTHKNHGWSDFTPFKALPLEFFSADIRFVDINSRGFSDLALLGPMSVRVYLNNGNGFETGVDVALPETAIGNWERDHASLVAFSDIAGSGQQHWVRISEEGVSFSPNLGHGKFGPVVKLSGFNPATPFNPERIYLADINGSGTTDLIYADSDKLYLYLNQAGNSYSEPHIIPLPEGLRYTDLLSKLLVADIRGTGVPSLVLSVVGDDGYYHHWRYDFTPVKSYLLSSVSNNMGAYTEWGYRNSAQYWLDEKKETPEAISRLPMPIYVQAYSYAKDEISGNSLSQSYTYRRGVFDQKEREFRGFGYISMTESVIDFYRNDSPEDKNTRIDSWYHLGYEDDDKHLIHCWSGDEEAFIPALAQLTYYDAEQQKDVILENPDEATRKGLYRGLQGMLIRKEIWDINKEVPLSVEMTRLRARLVQPTIYDDDSQDSVVKEPVVMPVELEKINYVYEGIVSDPVISQQVIIQQEEYGEVLHRVSINYPRRDKPLTNPYPPLLPETGWSSSYDEQQQIVHVFEERFQIVHFNERNVWRLGVLQGERRNYLHPDPIDIPQGEGFSFETLTEPRGILSANRPRQFAGQTQVHYATNVPEALALIDHIDVAEFDDESLSAFKDVMSETERDNHLTSAGYRKSERILPVPGIEPETEVWVASNGYTIYAERSALKFYRPLSQQTTLLSGKITYEYDQFTCGIIKTCDAAGNITTVEYDYRFMQPWKLTDLNDNIFEAKFNALGRVIASSFYGQEGEKDNDGAYITSGFYPVNDFALPDGNVTEMIEQALQNKEQIVFQYSGIEWFSWMGNISKEKAENSVIDKESIHAAKNLWDYLLSRQFITSYGHVCTEAYRWLERQKIYDYGDVLLSLFGNKNCLKKKDIHQIRTHLNLSGEALWWRLVKARIISVQGEVLLPVSCWQHDAQSDGWGDIMRSLLEEVSQMPVHEASFMADNYARPKREQRIRIAVSFSDGFGRTLQTSVLNEPGLAYLLGPSGELVLDDKNKPKQGKSEPRWAVSGRTEYNNKGLVKCVYQPFFLNDWHYASDASLRINQYADKYEYDALNREIRVETANQKLRRTSYFPWFSVHEDENDTEKEMEEQRDKIKK
ncbi:SpvB/TcaC N-terminal domain-containing protein [Photorhabdus temperata subsp. temperata]